MQYPSEVLEGFLPAIRNKTMPPLDRLGLLDDLFALVQAGQSPTTDVSFISYFLNGDIRNVPTNVLLIVLLCEGLKIAQ